MPDRDLNAIQPKDGEYDNLVREIQAFDYSSLSSGTAAAGVSKGSVGE
jgi:hypothetical protein